MALTLAQGARRRWTNFREGRDLPANWAMPGDQILTQANTSEAKKARLNGRARWRQAATAKFDAKGGDCRAKFAHPRSVVSTMNLKLKPERLGLQPDLIRSRRRERTLSSEGPKYPIYRPPVPYHLATAMNKIFLSTHPGYGEFLGRWKRARLRVEPKPFTESTGNASDVRRSLNAIDRKHS